MKVIVLRSKKPFYDDSPSVVEGIYLHTDENEKQIRDFIESTDAIYDKISDEYEKLENAHHDKLITYDEYCASEKYRDYVNRIYYICEIMEVKDAFKRGINGTHS